MDVDYFTRVKAEMLCDHVQRNLEHPSKISVLDIGCGVGNYHKLLEGNFARLVGVDVSEDSIEKARSRGLSSEFMAYDGDRLPFDDASFDIAYAICVIHHVPVDAWPRFFAQMYRVLKPGGYAMIFEHNPLNPLTMRVVNRCPFDKDAVLLKPVKTGELLGGAGFENITSRTILNIPSFGRTTRQLDQWIGHLPFGAQYLSVGAKNP